MCSLCVPWRTSHHVCESFDRWFLQLDTVYVCADRFVAERLQYVAIHALGCSVRSGCPLSGYQDMLYRCAMNMAGPWHCNELEKPLLKDTIAVPQTYMAASRAGWGSFRGGEWYPSAVVILGRQLLAEREGRCRRAILTRDWSIGIVLLFEH